MKIYSLDVKNINYEHIELNSYLGTINASPDLYEVFKLNGKWYALGMVAANSEYGAAHEIKKFNPKATETKYKNDITCPICGYVDRDSWEEDDENDNYQCGRCGATLEIERNVEITYSATVKELPVIFEEEQHEKIDNR